MIPIHASRRQFLRATAVTAFAGMLPARRVSADEVTPGSRLRLRFAVASDRHYGQRYTPFAEMTGDMVNPLFLFPGLALQPIFRAGKKPNPWHFNPRASRSRPTAAAAKRGRKR